MSENTNKLKYQDGKFFIEKSVLDNVEGAVDSSTGEKTITLDSNINVLGSLDISGATYSLCQSPEWIKVLVDAQERIIAGVRPDGSVYINKIEGVTDAIKEIREELERGVENLPEMMVEKSSTKMTVYKHLNGHYYIGYPLEYRQKVYTQGSYPSFYDNWGIGQVFLALYSNNQMENVADLFRNGEAELAIQTSRGDGESGDVFVGGAAHGFENIVIGDNGREISFMIDNIVYSENSVIALKEIASIQVIQNTQIYQSYSNTNPFANVTKQWSFIKNANLEISTKVKMLRDLALKQSEFAMFCVYRHFEGNTSKNYLTNKAVKNNKPFKIFTVEDGWESDIANRDLILIDFDCTKVTEYGEYGIGCSVNIKNANTKPNGGMDVFTNNSTYNKIYFDLTGAYSATTDEELYATQEWGFEGEFSN